MESQEIMLFLRPQGRQAGAGGRQATENLSGLGGLSSERAAGEREGAGDE